MLLFSGPGTGSVRMFGRCGLTTYLLVQSHVSSLRCALAYFCPGHKKMCVLFLFIEFKFISLCGDLGDCKW